MSDKNRIPIKSEADIVIARSRGREVAGRLGFSSTDLTIIATAISELARNIIEYARSGEIDFDIITQNGGKGVSIIARDDGPGILDIDRAMQDGFSTGKGLGLGLPGVRRLMDEFEIDSEIEKGTTVKVKKWR